MASAPTPNDLEQALRDAGSAHHEYEQTFLGGERDTQWAGFYAAFTLGRLGAIAKPSVLTKLLQEASGDDWASAAASLVVGRL